VLEPVRSLLLAAIALCGLGVALLSTMTWVKFEVFPANLGGSPVTAETSGLHTSVWRDTESVNEAEVGGIGWCSCDVSVGDGYLTAAFGLVLIAAAAVAAFTVFSGRALLISLLAALLTIIVTGFNAFADWRALVSISESGTTIPADGDVRIAAFAILGVGGVAALLSAVVWVIDRAHENDAGYDYDDEDEEEGSANGGDSWVSV
jgi:hypothetical protein